MKYFLKEPIDLAPFIMFIQKIITLKCFLLDIHKSSLEFGSMLVKTKGVISLVFFAIEENSICMFCDFSFFETSWTKLDLALCLLKIGKVGQKWLITKIGKNKNISFKFDFIPK